MFGSGGSNEVQETPDQVVEQQNNVKLWNYYATTYKPYIDKVISNQVSNDKSSNQANRVAGQINSEVMKAASVQKPDDTAMGISKKMNIAADVSTQAQEKGAEGVKKQQMESLQNIVNIGRGQQTQAQQGQEGIADQSVSKAIQDKMSDLQTQGARENAIGSAVGTAAAIGTRAYTKFMDPSIPEYTMGPTTPAG